VAHSGGEAAADAATIAADEEEEEEAQQTERPKKENILDLSKYMDKQITVKFSGGREGESMVAQLDRSHRPALHEYALLTIVKSLERSRATTS
jgi:hypothetical protein